MLRHGIIDNQLSIGTMKYARQAGIGFLPGKYGKHIFIAPVRTPVVRCPVIIILRLPSHRDHAVD